MQDEHLDYHPEYDDNRLLAPPNPTTNTAKVKPHIIRRHIEDYLEQKELERRLKEVFDDEL